MIPVMGVGKVLLRTAAAVALLLCASGAYAERRALLIGVPSVPGDPSLTLEGPAHDVEAIRNALLADWGFAQSNIDTLVGASASRSAVLGALERLADGARAGDQFFIYFSGHGTSAHDLDSKLDMDPGTGALVPADWPVGSSQEMVTGLIVAKRDLRPIFERLDRSGADTFVAFDACYSGDTYKRIPEKVRREIPPELKERLEQDLARLDLDAMEAPEPYERLVYLSASARDELAYETPESEAGPGGEWPTIDGRAHGDFTNGLLLALRGEADLDSDGQITYVELRQYLREHLDGSQTPQLHPAGKPVVNGPVLGQARAPGRRAATASDDTLRVRVDPPHPELTARLAVSERLAVTDGPYDLKVEVISAGHRERFQVSLSSGLKILSNDDDADITEVVDVLERRATAKRIWGLAYPAQDLRTRIKIDPDQDRYRGGDLVSLTLAASEPAWHLLLSINSHGRIFVLHPYEQSDVRRAAAEEEVLVVSTNVVTPYGPERLVAFAFKDRPSGYGEWDWLGKNKPLDGAATEDLIAMLQARASEPGRAKTHLIFYSYSGP